MLALDLKVVSPAEFWELTPTEAGVIIDYYVDSSTKKKPESGKLSEEQYQRLETRRAKLRAKGLNVL